MTAIRGRIKPPAERGALGIHSLDQFVLSLPDLMVVEKFWSAEGHSPEDFLYLSGPQLPQDFVLNYESPLVLPSDGRQRANHQVLCGSTSYTWPGTPVE
jgi:hypothetical protein